jgi:hypothetical protein
MLVSNISLTTTMTRRVARYTGAGVSVFARSPSAHVARPFRTHADRYKVNASVASAKQCRSSKRHLMRNASAREPLSNSAG